MLPEGFRRRVQTHGLATQRGRLPTARHQQTHSATLPGDERATFCADWAQVLLQAGGRGAVALREV